MSDTKLVVIHFGDEQDDAHDFTFFKGRKILKKAKVEKDTLSHEETIDVLSEFFDDEKDESP